MLFQNYYIIIFKETAWLTENHVVAHVAYSPKIVHKLTIIVQHHYFVTTKSVLKQKKNYDKHINLDLKPGETEAVQRFKQTFRLQHRGQLQPSWELHLNIAFINL